VVTKIPTQVQTELGWGRLESAVWRRLACDCVSDSGLASAALCGHRWDDTSRIVGKPEAIRVGPRSDLRNCCKIAISLIARCKLRVLV
jgi:hypothetical protein